MASSFSTLSPPTRLSVVIVLTVVMAAVAIVFTVVMATVSVAAAD